MGSACLSSSLMRQQMASLSFSIIGCVGTPLLSPKGMRSAIITDAQGEAVWQKMGQVPQETLETAIQEALK
ncbi:MAG: hypothetical protein ACPGWR_32155 [Ardenticatenaceae bacterium]